MPRFSREQRLRKPKDFKKSKNHQRLSQNPYFVIYYKKSETGQARIGVIVSKANVRLAASRNRIKRVAREVFRLAQYELDSIDYIVNVQKQANGASNQELAACLRKLFMLAKKS